MVKNFKVGAKSIFKLLILKLELTLPITKITCQMGFIFSKNCMQLSKFLKISPFENFPLYGRQISGGTILAGNDVANCLTALVN